MSSKHSALWVVMAVARVHLIRVRGKVVGSLVWRLGSIDRKIRLLDRQIRDLAEIHRLCEIAAREFGADNEHDTVAMIERNSSSYAKN